jgi:diguanylate cyclase (GGDEF)-like protein
MVVIIAALLILIIKLPKNKLKRMIHICYYVFSIYAVISSSFISPNSLCVTIIAIVFIYPVLIIDRNLYIYISSVTITAVYSVFTLIYKNVSFKFDEPINALAFFLVGLIIGTFTRNAQLENFDMKRLAEISANTDSLTRLPNRTNFFTQISGRSSNITSIIMVDIDLFKNLNDTYGHITGDECLKKIGEILLDFEFSDGIKFFRYGGDEFVGISKYKITSEKLKNICKKLNNSIINLDIENSTAPSGKVTLSIGASLHHDELNITDTLRFADYALYTAKHIGKNKTVIYGE